MGEFLCKDICPLPKGNASSVREGSEESWRVMEIPDDKGVGYVSMRIKLIQREPWGTPARRLISEEEFEELTNNGLTIDEDSIACPDMSDRDLFALKHPKGFTSRSVKCNYTDGPDLVTYKYRPSSPEVKFDKDPR